MANEMSLEYKVRSNAEGKMIAKKLLVPQAKERKAAHIAVCKKLVELSDKHGQYPITYLVYFAVGKNAHRNEVIDNGYSTIDTNKAETILNWLHIVANANMNGKIVRNANLAHVLCKYYDKVSKETTDFEKVAKKIKADRNGKLGNFKEIAESIGFKTDNATDKVNTHNKKDNALESKKSGKNAKSIEITEINVASAPTNVESVVTAN